MPVRVTERELIVPSLEAAAATPNGRISTTELIGVLTDRFQPEGQDAEILGGRNDTHFSQKVRNLVSHRQGLKSMFTLGYATYTEDGIEITDAGSLLSQLPE